MKRRGGLWPSLVCFENLYRAAKKAARGKRSSAPVAKAWLAEAKMRIQDLLNSLRLRLHPRKCVISRVEDGTRFLGFRVFPSHRLLARENVVRMKRRLRRLQQAYAAGEIEAEQLRSSIVSWIGHARHADSHRLRERPQTWRISEAKPKPRYSNSQGIDNGSAKRPGGTPGRLEMGIRMLLRA